MRFFPAALLCTTALFLFLLLLVSSAPTAVSALNTSTTTVDTTTAAPPPATTFAPPAPHLIRHFQVGFAPQTANIDPQFELNVTKWFSEKSGTQLAGLEIEIDQKKTASNGEVFCEFSFEGNKATEVAKAFAELTKAQRRSLFSIVGACALLPHESVRTGGTTTLPPNFFGGGAVTTRPPPPSETFGTMNLCSAEEGRNNNNDDNSFAQIQLAFFVIVIISVLGCVVYCYCRSTDKESGDSAAGGANRPTGAVQSPVAGAGNGLGTAGARPYGVDPHDVYNVDTGLDFDEEMVVNDTAFDADRVVPAAADGGGGEGGGAAKSGGATAVDFSDSRW